MKPRLPALNDSGAGLADGLRQWRQVQEAFHGAGPQAKRSPKERSAVPGAVTMASQVALDRLGVVTRPDGPRRRLGSGQQDRGGMGTDLGGQWAPGLVFLCLQLRLSPTSNQITEGTTG